MSSVETYMAEVPDWATQIEFVVHEPSGEAMTLGRLRLETKESPNLFLVAVASTPNGLCPPFLDVEIQLTDPSGSLLSPPHTTPNTFTSPRLIIVEYPSNGRWTVSAKAGALPYAVTVMAFHPAVPPNSPPSPGATARSPFKCRACKVTAKALALAIVAAAALPALPAALITAVGTFLGVAAPIAAAFILSVLGDTADVIAEKLCKKVGLC